jgi:hypothetical protein
MKPCPAMITSAGPIGSESAHGSEPVFELTVVGLDRIVRVSFELMRRRGHQLREDGGVDRGGVGDAT